MAVWQETGALRQSSGILVRLSHAPKASARALEQAAGLGADSSPIPRPESRMLASWP